MVSGLRWGDDMDEEDRVLPPSTETKDQKGIITQTDYKRSATGDIIKVTTRMREVTIEQKMYESAQRRKTLAKFGDAAKNNDMVTIVQHDPITFERTNLKPHEKEAKGSMESSLRNIKDKNVVVSDFKSRLEAKRKERLLKQSMGLYKPEEKKEEESASRDGTPQKGGSYVPMHLRGGASGGAASMDRRNEEPSLRVTNLGEDTDEQDLRELFGNFGYVTRCYVAKNHQTGASRGFAFVSMANRADAEKAREKLDGKGFDSLILRVEWSQPRKM